ALHYLTTEWNRTRTMLEAGHFTYLGPYCPALEDHTSNSTYMNNARWMMRRMGYEYRLDRLQWTPEVRRGRRLELTLSGENQGVAPFYYPWQVKMALLNGANQPVLQWDVKADIRRWLPGAFSFTTVSPAITLPRGQYRLAVGIIDPWRNRPRIQFANNLSVVNGWTVLEQVRVV
ncbi:MAG: DUF4832 domain-containing protein, partial [Fimbriimonadales bacterium]|nr:DUF4832 domain-containing protein [Fimbriimonadales bacterium]